jgi:hypothetical protein
MRRVEVAVQTYKPVGPWPLAATYDDVPHVYHIWMAMGGLLIFPMMASTIRCLVPFVI